MAKYSLTFKLKVVTAYLNSEGGYRSLAKKYGAKDASQVLLWINVFKEFGKDGLCRKWDNTRYISEFKLAVVESYLTSKLLYRQIAFQYGLNKPPLIARWKSEFMKYGLMLLLSDRKDEYLLWDGQIKKQWLPHILNHVAKSKKRISTRASSYFRIRKTITLCPNRERLFKRIEEIAPNRIKRRFSIVVNHIKKVLQIQLNSSIIN